MKSIRYTIPGIFQPIKDLVAAETTRMGGVSLPPYASLNLGLFTKDDPVHVAQNRQLLFNDLGISSDALASSFQVHGDNVLMVIEPGQHHGYDALITNRPNCFLAVKVADCVPMLIFDSQNSAVAAIHAGWRGTVKQIAQKTLLEMEKAFGTKPEDCLAYIGTCIDECSFEVDADVADHFGDRDKRWDGEKQKFFVDLKKANKTQIMQSGIPEDQLEVSPHSTVLNNSDYFSYRKENGTTGRFMAIIGVKA